MSFVQEKLVQWSAQSSGTINEYAYEPANGDTVADVTGANYFAQSRFIGTDGWANGIVTCVMADATVVIQIDGAGTSGSTFHPAGDQTSIQFKNKGVALGTPGTVTTVDTLGNNITASRVGNTVTFRVGDIPFLTQNVAQVAHGFAVGDVVYDNAGTWAKAQANSPSTLAHAIVSYVTDVNNFQVVTSGYAGVFAGLTAGATYYLSPTTPGAITSTVPANTNYTQVIGIANSATSLLFIPSVVSSVGDAIARRNLSGTAQVNMGAGNYTMTNAECQAAMIIVLNPGTGHTLTWPTSSDGYYPLQQVLVTLFVSQPITIASQTGGATSAVSPGTGHIVSVNAGVFAVNLGTYIASDARASSNGTSVAAAGNTNMTDAHFGTLLSFDGAAAQTYTIIAGMVRNNAVVDIDCGGAGGVTITAGAGTTITGAASHVLASGQSCRLWRDGITDNYRLTR